MPAQYLSFEQVISHIPLKFRSEQASTLNAEVKEEKNEFQFE